VIASVLIIVLSVALFVYWFRYTCLLILSTKTARNYGGAVAEANRLSFPEVHNLLRAESAVNMDALRDALEKDYRLLTSLIRNSASQEAGADDLEERLLMLDFALMRGWYAVGGVLGIARAHALREMCDIVSHFANSMGQRVAHYRA
jgi:hypothetical protein